MRHRSLIYSKLTGGKKLKKLIKNSSIEKLNQQSDLKIN